MSGHNPQTTNAVLIHVVHLMQEWNRQDANLGQCTPVGIGAFIDVSVQRAMALLDEGVQHGYIHKSQDAHYGFVYMLTRKGMTA